MIVGHKIDTYLTARGFRGNYVITEHAEVRELHPTKGWRLINHRRKDQTVGRMPSAKEWRACHSETFVPTERERSPRPLRGIRP